MSDVNRIIIYTDGSCIGNPGPGGYAALIMDAGAERTVQGGEAATTNNRMELMAAIAAIESLTGAQDVMIYTDSIYVRDGITRWIHGWRKNGWKNAKKEAVKNQDLWQRLDAAQALHRIEWHWIKAHNGHVHNERVDTLAREAILSHMMAET